MIGEYFILYEIRGQSIREGEGSCTVNVTKETNSTDAFEYIKKFIADGLQLPKEQVFIKALNKI